MKKISDAVNQIMQKDDLIAPLAQRGLLNVSAYAREIKPQVEELVMKNVKEGSIIAAVNRALQDLPALEIPTENIIQNLTVHSNLKGISYERTEATSQQIRKIYQKTGIDNKTYLTVTQGINEITIVAETSVLNQFKQALNNKKTIYYKDNLVGITTKFDISCLETPNIMYGIMRRIALKNINLIEVVSTATELTFIIARQDLQVALTQLQKNI